MKPLQIQSNISHCKLTWLDSKFLAVLLFVCASGRSAVTERMQISNGGEDGVADAKQESQNYIGFPSSTD